MSEVKFTPGQWSFSMDGDSNYARIYPHDLGRVDKVKGGDMLAGYCGEHNAHLIAAAPDMYEALNICLGWLTGGLDGDWGDNFGPIAVTRAALAKARGEQ